MTIKINYSHRGVRNEWQHCSIPWNTWRGNSRRRANQFTQIMGARRRVEGLKFRPLETVDHPILCPLENVHPPSDFGHASNWNFRDEYEFQKSFLLFQLFQGCRWLEPPYFKEFRMDYRQSNLKCMILESCRFERFCWCLVDRFFPPQFGTKFLSMKKIKNLSRNFYKLMDW